MHQLMTLSEIMQSGDGGLFLKIPDYQRGYSWQKPQREDLLNDLTKLAEHGSRHFTGTIVAAQSSADDNTLDLIDGQQRLTSLLLLIARTLFFMEAEATSDARRDELAAWRHTFLVYNGGAGKTTFRLRLQKETQKRFKDVIETRALETENLPTRNKANDNLVEAADEFDRWLDNGGHGLSYGHILELVTTRLGFIFYTPQEKLEAGLMFEVINSRGKPLSELEKVKNFLIYLASQKDMPDLHERVNSGWAHILHYLSAADLTSNEDERAFLRVCWTLFNDPRSRPEETVYAALRRNAEACQDNAKLFEMLNGFIGVMENAAATYDKMYSPAHDHETRANVRELREIALHPRNAGILPLIVALFYKAGSRERLQDRADILALLEKLNFRYYVLRIAARSDSNYRELFELAHRYFQDATDGNGQPTDIEFLRGELIAFVARHTATAKLVHKLVLEPDEGWDFYEWNGLKYFLANYEQSFREDLHEGNSTAYLMKARDPSARNDFYTREHIFAQNATEQVYDGWAEFMARRLGNFVITREVRNIFASNAPVQDKIYEAYNQAENTMLYQVRELKELWDEAYKWAFNERGWSNHCAGSRTNCIQRLGDLREESMVEFALQRWGVPEVDGDAPNEVEVETNYHVRGGSGAGWEFVGGPAFDKQQKNNQQAV